MFSLRGPLCAGEALSPQGRGGRAALSYMARRDVGPRDRPRTSADRPHISPLVAFRKRGDYLLFTVEPSDGWWASGRAAHVDLVSTGGSMMIGGTSVRVTLQVYLP